MTTLPHNSDYEWLIVGAALKYRDCRYVASDLVAAEDFHDVRCGAIYQSIAEVEAARQPVNRFTVQQRLAIAHSAECVAVALQTAAVVDVGMVRQAAEKVRDLAMRRRVPAPVPAGPPPTEEEP